MKTVRALVLVSLMLTLTTLSFGPQEARVLRFPTVSNDQIVFTSAGDLYTVPLAGGVARKLTSFAEGYEAFPRFSPDGSAIAFTGGYRERANQLFHDFGGYAMMPLALAIIVIELWLLAKLTTAPVSSQPVIITRQKT